MTKNSRNKPEPEWLVGCWRASSGAIDVVFTIEKASAGFQINATDESDGEKLLVSKVKWNGESLSFETRTASNDWRTKNRITLIAKTKAIQELTYWEPLEKISPETVRNKSAKNKRERSLSKRPRLSS